MARDLVPDFRVTVVDLRQDALDALAAAGIGTRRADLGSAEAVKAAIADADLVVGAVPGFMGFRTMRTVLEAGKDIVDISFYEEDPFGLEDVARDRIALMDCGIAPGCGNIILGHLEGRLSSIQRWDCLVGGLPVVRTWPYEYKAGFSPIDVIEEYTRPARYVAHGQLVTRPALSEPELVDLPGVGTLEAFNTDGLRSLATTLKVPHMRERTLRYPGHIELMRVFRDLGLFGLEPVQVGEATLRPRDLLAKLLAKKWTYEEGEEDLTVMRVVVEGVASKVRTKLTWDLFDRFDRETGASSMSRTTAFPCTSVSRMMVDGMIAKPGVFAPEHLEPIPGVLDRVLKELRARGIEYRASVDQIAAERPTRTRGGRTG